MSVVDELAAGKYISLTTFKKDGTAVATPVWVGQLGNHLVVTTQAESWKVKRARNNPRVRVAACDMRGKLTGVAFNGTAEVVSGAEATEIEGVIAKKYGLMFRLITWWEQRKGVHSRAGVVITLDPLT